jgi:hypothetical protein
MDVLDEFGGSCWLEKVDSLVIWDFLFNVSEQNRTTYKLGTSYYYDLDTSTMSGGVFKRREPENQQRCSQRPPERVVSLLPWLLLGN